MSSSARKPWFGVLGIVFVLVCMPVGWLLWSKYNPYVLERPAVVAARSLADTARQRPLTDEEFSRTLDLFECDESIARLILVAVVQLEAERSSERKSAAVAALSKHQLDHDPAVRRAMSAALGRLQQ